MARLTDTQWDALQTAYETSARSLRDLAADYGISAATICRRAKAAGWQRMTALTEPPPVLAKPSEANTANDANTLSDAKQSKQPKQPKQTNKPETSKKDTHLSVSVSDESITDWHFQQQSNQDMQKVRDKAMTMLDTVDSPAQVKSILETLRLLRETVLGKADEARKPIASPQRIERVIIDPSASNHADAVMTEPAHTLSDSTAHTPRAPKPPA